LLSNKDKIKVTLDVLYRKAHYDVCYNKEYQPLLDIYSNLKMSFGIDNYIVEYNNIIQKEKILNQLYPFNPEESVVFNKLYLKKEKKKNKMKSKKKRKK
jgi:hypothetical protein